MHKPPRIEKTKETAAKIFWKLEADGCEVIDLADVRNKPVYVIISPNLRNWWQQIISRSWIERRLRSCVVVKS